MPNAPIAMAPRLSFRILRNLFERSCGSVLTHSALRSSISMPAPANRPSIVAPVSMPLSTLLPSQGVRPKSRRSFEPLPADYRSKSEAVTPSAIASFSTTVMVGLRAPRSRSETYVR